MTYEHDQLNRFTCDVKRCKRILFCTPSKHNLYHLLLLFLLQSQEESVAPNFWIMQTQGSELSCQLFKMPSEGYFKNKRQSPATRHWQWGPACLHPSTTCSSLCQLSDFHIVPVQGPLPELSLVPGIPSPHHPTGSTPPRPWQVKCSCLEDMFLQSKLRPL
jgi:hypothetical protein